MSRQEKLAIFNLVVFAVAVALYIPLLFKFGGPAFAVFGLCALWAIGPFFAYPKLEPREPLDERELLIERRAEIVGRRAFWGIFVLVVMLVWHLNRGGTIAADHLPPFLFVGFAIQVVASSVATVVLYRWGQRGQGAA